MNIPPVGAEVFHAGGWTDSQTDRQTDMAKLIIAVCNLANAPKTRQSKLKICFLNFNLTTCFGRKRPSSCINDENNTSKKLHVTYINMKFVLRMKSPSLTQKGQVLQKVVKSST